MVIVETCLVKGWMFKSIPEQSWRQGNNNNLPGVKQPWSLVGYYDAHIQGCSLSVLYLILWPNLGWATVAKKVHAHSSKVAQTFRCKFARAMARNSRSNMCTGYWCVHACGVGVFCILHPQARWMFREAAQTIPFSAALWRDVSSK